MTEPTSRQTRLHELFTAALHLPPAQQEPYLLRTCPDDPALVREVLALLRAADSAPDDFLTPPPPPPDPPSFLSKATPHPPAPYDPAKDTLLGRRLKGRYTIQHRLGEGGMSVVYEGAQDHPRRRVAIKIMRPQFVSPKVLRRFRDEPEILAQLNHPHIVRVFEADVEDFGAGDGPQPYFVMEYVDGIPLTQYVRDGRLPRDDHPTPTHDRRLTLRERLELFAIVCDAVQEAHQRGIIHRDLKPSNILVTAEGKPMLLDFGVAKVLATSGLAIEHTLTGELQLIGTLQYMSPEQCDVGLSEPRPSGSGPSGTSPDAPGSSSLRDEPGTSSLRDESPAQSDERPKVSSRSDELPAPNPQPQPPSPSLDTRSDVYALGVLLYELVTERLPYDVSNMTIVSAARTICEAAPTPPSHFDRRLRGDLDAIILKALEKDRTRRYASAAHLEEDVRRYLSGEPTFARPTTRWRKMSRWVGNHPKLTTGTIAFCAGLLAWLPAEFAWERGFQSGADLGLPCTFEWRFDGKSVVLKDGSGRSLNTFTGPRVRIAEVLTASRAGGVGLRVVVGIEGQPEAAEPPSLTAYRWNQEDQALALVWERLHPDGGPLPDPHAREYGPERFHFANGCVADIFSESPGDEVVAVYQGGGHTQCVLQVHDLEGIVLYRVWADAQIEAMIWLAESRQLVCYGADGSAFRLAREGMSDELADRYRHTKVVFALRPEFDKRHATFLCLEPAALEGTVRPEWCRMLGPCDVVDDYVDHVFFSRAERGGFRLTVSLQTTPHAQLGSTEFGSDGVLRKRNLDADNIKAASTPGTEGIPMRVLRQLDLFPHPAIRDEWIPITKQGETEAHLYNLHDCEQDPADGPPQPHSTLDCPLNAYGVHGSPYRWARLLRDGRGVSPGSQSPPNHPFSPP